jgi:hypothetical protein
MTCFSENEFTERVKHMKHCARHLVVVVVVIGVSHFKMNCLLTIKILRDSG